MTNASSTPSLSQELAQLDDELEKALKRKARIENRLSSDEKRIALKLATLDAKMRKSGISYKSMIKARLDFLVAAVEGNVGEDDLNLLGEYVEECRGIKTCLSERSLDCVFENMNESDDVLEAFRKIAAVNEYLKSAAIRLFGERILRPRTNHTADLFMDTSHDDQRMVHDLRNREGRNQLLEAETTLIGF